MHDRWRKFLAVLDGPDQPYAIFDALAALTADTVGTLLFTATTHDTLTMRSLRLHSGNEAAYPVGGWKPPQRASRPRSSPHRRRSWTSMGQVLIPTRIGPKPMIRPKLRRISCLEKCLT